MKSKIPSFLIAGLFLGLAGCGGGEGAPAPSPPPQTSPPPPPPPAGTVIGPAGGTVTGPNGTSVVIPAGALATNTAINIAASPAGTPALPGSFTAAGQMFEFTPHGTTFALPVTVTLPLDPALIPAGQTPVLYKTNAQNQWTQVVNATVGTNSISGQVTSFSQLVGGLLRNDPERSWVFSVISGDGALVTPVPGGTGTALVGQLVEKTAEFGPNLLDDMFNEAPPALPRNGISEGWVMSTPNGVTFEVFAESPNGRPAFSNPIGSKTEFTQKQSYIKRFDNARLTYTVTRVSVNMFDLNPSYNDPRFILTGITKLTAKPYLNDDSDNPFHSRSGIAGVKGNASSWVPIYGNDFDFGGQFWDKRHFVLTTEPFFYTPPNSNFTCPGTRATLTLLQPMTFEVDVSDLLLGDEFTLEMVATAATQNNLGGSLFDCRGGYISAFLRDPAGFGGGTIEFSGLEPSNNPVPGTGVAPLLPPAPCVPGPGPNPAAGVLQFETSNYESDEGGLAPAVVVTRTGGSTGVVTATFTTSNGTAVAGTDYVAVNRTVTFADGEDGTQFLTVPMLPDVLSGEPDKTVNLTLSQPGGCAALGTQTNAVLTIYDDDALPGFTVGGTVSGLIGTGLTLQDHHFDTLTLDANGPFTFRLPTTSGLAYGITITAQPGNPVQVCSIANGSGTMGNANVTNVEVTCAPPPPPGGLDPGFGGGTGKVSTAFGGDETDMLLQTDDGKIIMIGGSSSDFVMARYMPDGSPDAGFGAGGRVTTDIAGGADAAYAAALLADGRILVAGTARVGSSEDFALVRYLPNGSVDTTFGTQGRTTTDFFGQRDRAFAIAIQPDGRIVLAGDAVIAFGNSDFAVARYDANGVLDTTFGGGTGKVSTDIAGHVDVGKNVAIESGGTILVTGTITMGTSAALAHTGLARYSNAGVLDSSLATNGIQTIPNLQLGNGLALLPDGKILVAGNALVAGQTVFGLMRLDTQGFPDLNFGSMGLATVGFSTQVDFASDIALDAQGRILLSGQASNSSNGDFALARLTPTGQLDGTFDGDGKITVDFFGAGDGAENVLVQPDGRILLGGFAANGTALGYALARVNP